jgi:hypothetical protein
LKTESSGRCSLSFPSGGGNHSKWPLANTRCRGLMKLIGGLIVGVVMFLLLLGLGRLTGHYQASALAAFPPASSMVGLMEIALGIDIDATSKTGRTSVAASSYRPSRKVRGPVRTLADETPTASIVATPPATDKLPAMTALTPSIQRVRAGRARAEP